MADLSKKKRTQALKQFTRNANLLQGFLDDQSASEIVAPQYEKFRTCWDQLEDAHETFIDETDMANIETDKDGFPYLDVPGQQYKELMLKFSTYLKENKQAEKNVAKEDEKERKLNEKELRKNEEEERKEAENVRLKEENQSKFEAGKAELGVMMSAFKHMCGNLQKSLESASAPQKKVEWKKVEDEYTKLKEKLLHVAATEPSADITDIKKTFTEDVDSEFVESQNWILGEIKDLPLTSGGGDTHRKMTSTKKEAVKLPNFKGDVDADPFLQYPIWKASWNKLIVEYDEDYRDTLLGEHVDEVAREQFAGYENNYEEAMKRLESYYGDPIKVVSRIVNEVNSQSPVLEGAYHLLVKFSDVLSRNYTRLVNLGLDHELSNTSAMYSIVRKFPRNVGEKWTEYISVQELSVKSKPFPTFIQWIAKQRPIWEQMGATIEQEVSHDMSSFYGAMPPQGSEVRRKKCHTCQEEGHLMKNCPRKTVKKVPKTRQKPKVKKYWCAFHKDDPTRNCFSNSCQDLRRMTDKAARVKLITDNSDCFHCCGDHLPTDCPRKDRVCGNGKPNRGCNRGHKVHELFCQDAQVCMSIIEVHSAQTKDGVVLAIMQVRTVKGKKASVLYDGGFTGNFICEAFARACNFRSSKKRLLVTTLGGVVSDYKTVTFFQCTMMDEDGNWHSFEAYGIESITGAVSQIGLPKLQTLFPQLTKTAAERLMRLNRVDILIGICQASWLPQREEQAVGGGDLWTYKGMFGRCVGGRHPNLTDLTKKNEKNLFTVVETFHVNVIESTSEIINHELEYCPSRVHQFSTVSPQKAICSSSDIDDSWPAAGVEPLSLEAATCVVCHARISDLPDETDFFRAESLGVAINPLCGACKCSKCPIPGAKFSFSQQQELDEIKKQSFL